MSLYELKAPQLGEGIHNLHIIGFLKQPGEWVREDEPLLEVETEKATMEIPSPVEGVIQEIVRHPGERVPVGAALLYIEPKSCGEEVIIQEAEPNVDQDSLCIAEPSGMPNPITVTLPHNQLRLAQNLRVAWNTVIPATIVMPIDWQALQRYRQFCRKEADITPSSLDIIVWCTAQAMQEFPKFRARYQGGDSLTISPTSLIGIAVELPEDTLGTAVVDVEPSMPLAAISQSIKAELQAVRLNGGAETCYHSLIISDMSMFGVTGAIPVLVTPSVSTLFIGAPYGALNADSEVRRVSDLTLTFDHRIINGAYAAKFLHAINKKIKIIASLQQQLVINGGNYD